MQPLQHFGDIEIQKCNPYNVLGPLGRRKCNPYNVLKAQELKSATPTAFWSLGGSKM